MDWIIIGLAFTTFFSTLIGGTIAIKFKKALPYFFAFASGTLIAVTFFDILPESLEISESVNLPTRYIMITIVASFLFYSLLEKYFLIHHHKEGEGHGHIMGPIGAGSLVIHSFLDGVAIGAAYRVNPAIGLVVALAVIFHDFTDGINTVTLMLKNKQHLKNAQAFLLMDAIAPIMGIALTSLIGISQIILSLILAAFAGEFIYIGAVNLLPETYKNPNWKTIFTTIVGVLLIFTLTSVI
ncbi:MAG: ZIP family metal transporter [Candidatus Thermoplasmatota archaeon]|nr:ZIP family metal transporter [Candidatus Thermoplasmatota archaeon]